MMLTVTAALGAIFLGLKGYEYYLDLGAQAFAAELAALRPTRRSRIDLRTEGDL